MTVAMPFTAKADTPVRDIDRDYKAITKESKEYDPIPKTKIDDIVAKVLAKLDSHSHHWARCLGEDTEPFFEEAVIGYTSKGRATTTSYVSPQAALMCAECPIRSQCAAEALANPQLHSMSVMAGVRIPYGPKLSKTATESLMSSVKNCSDVPALVRWYVVVSATALRFHNGNIVDSFKVVRGHLPQGIFRYVAKYLEKYPVTAFTVH